MPAGAAARAVTDVAGIALAILLPQQAFAGCPLFFQKIAECHISAFLLRDVGESISLFSVFRCISETKWGKAVTKLLYNGREKTAFPVSARTAEPMRTGDSMKRETHPKSLLKRLTAILVACLLAGCMLGLAGCLDDPDDPAGGGSDSGYTQSSGSSDSGKKESQSSAKTDSGKTDSGKQAADKQSSSKQNSSSSATGTQISKNGTYTSKKDVALYIHTYGCLPSNFISKTKARNAGWDSNEGNLDEVCPGKSIGGSIFYNDEGKLPDAQGRTWKECDINYHGGYRGGERIVFSSDGLIYYTKDHYKTFEQLY